MVDKIVKYTPDAVKGLGVTFMLTLADIYMARRFAMLTLGMAVRDKTRYGNRKVVSCVLSQG